MSKLLILIDGSALAYRSFFGFIRNPLINSRGENTSAVYGFVNSLLKLLEQTSPSHIACVFDTPAPTFRHKVYKQYKSTRAKMPEDLVDSLPWIKEAVAGFNIPIIEMEGFEADDIIGTLARKASDNGFDIGMFTGDKDYYQLVDEHIRLLHPKTFEWYGKDQVEKKMGVFPERIIDLLALMGDTSDNIPGVPGVGEKTALELLKQFGDFDKVLNSADKISKKRISKSLKENVELAQLSYQLVTIDCNVPVRFEPDTLSLEEPDREKLTELFKRMEFRRLLEKFSPAPNRDEKPLSVKTKVTYETIDSVSRLDEILDVATRKVEVALDTETTSTNPFLAELVGISLSFDEGEAYYIPLKHDDEKANLPLNITLERFERFFDTKVKIIGHNLKYDRQIFNNYGLELKTIYFDTMIASYVIDPGRRVHKLSALAMDFLDYRMQSITELIGSGARQKSFSVVPVDKATFYSAEDADFSLRLKNLLYRRLREQKLDELFFNLEMPLMPVLGEMEKTGVAIDVAFLKKLSAVYGEKMAQIEGEIYDEAGERFNINSPAQLRVILFDKLQLPSSKKTAKVGEKSTGVEVLEKLARIHPFPRMILDYRLLMKLKSTYIDALPKLVDLRTGRVHTSFNQTVTATGRLSSSEPNLQNIPIRTDEGKEIRKAFVAREDFDIFSADYSQIELRLMAHFAGDKALIESFNRGEDIHRRTAAEVFGIKLEDVTEEHRRAAKTANFAIIYGVSAYGLSQQSGLSVKESQDYIDAYFDRYPGVKRYMDEIKAFAREKGYVETLLNRRRYLPDINSHSRQAREFAERTAINTPIQGTAADMIKLAMIHIARKLKTKKSKMILQVHDELVFEQASSERDYLQKMVKTEMEKAFTLKVPIKVDLGEGANWLEAH